MSNPFPPPIALAKIEAGRLKGVLDSFLRADTDVSLAIAVPLQPADEADARILLPLTEQERATRFRFADDRLRFLLGRACLRCLLAYATASSAKQLNFRVSDHGKPFLSGGLHFNLSHSGELILIGLNKTSEIGVDVEAVRPIPDWMALAAAHMTRIEQELMRRRQPPNPEVEFLRAWTRKEAVAKAAGLGLSLALTSFSVLPAQRHWQVIATEAPLLNKTWSGFDLAIGEDYTAAIATAAATHNCAGIITPFPALKDLVKE